MSEYRRYNLTLTVVDQSQRDKFRKLSRPDTFFEIRPNREVGQRGAYSVEMTEAEYHEALRDAESPFSNLLVIEPESERKPWTSVPGSTALTYLAAQEADSLGLTGSGVVVGTVDSGLSQTLASSVFSGRVKAARSFATGGINYTNPFYDATGHGSEMSGLAVPPDAQIAVAKTGEDLLGAGDTDGAAAIYWLADEVGADVILLEFQLDISTTVLSDAVSHAVGKNILVVAPTGNSGAFNDGGPGENIVVYPAGLSGVLAISNYLSSTDAIESTSNYGHHTFAAAPSDVNGYTVGGGEQFFGDMGGTSASSAMATGIVARFLSGNVSAGNVKSYLASTARRTGASPIYEGNGVLQLAAAWNKLKADQAPATNPDNSIYLPRGGQVTPTKGDIPGGLPPQTTVYPTGEPTYQGAGTFVLPEGGSAQLPSGSSIPLPEGSTGGAYPLATNDEISPLGGTSDGTDPSYCDDAAYGGSGEEEPIYEYWVYTWEISADAATALTSGLPEYLWAPRAGDTESRLFPGLNTCKFYDAATHVDDINALTAEGWWQTGSTLVRLCPPNSWWRQSP